jgi:GWxTD domain-containing protein
LTPFKNIKKALKLAAALIFFSSFAVAQINAYFHMGSFNVPQKQAFAETYLTLVGQSLAKKKINGQFQNSVNIKMVILQDSNIVKAYKYNLNGPLFSDTMKTPSFIDNQRYPLSNGNYLIQMEIKDNFNPKQKVLEIRHRFSIEFNQHSLQASSIQVLESYKKSSPGSSISKSGYDLIPYNINYFPETQNELSFYFEIYNSDSVLGRNKPFIFYYYIENSENLSRFNSFGSFKKQTTASVNVLLGKLDISKLGTGNYNLVIEVKDDQNKLQHQSKYYFQRLNRALDLASLTKADETRTVQEYFGSCNNADTLKMFVECLWPIANAVDKERLINQSVKKDPEMMKKYIIDFWQRRAADTANPLKMWGSYYKSVQEVMVLFKCGKQPGYYTERGRVYLQYGPPNQRSQQNADLNTFPYEIWQYYRLNDMSNGQFFSNRKFVFVNKNIADDCHTLVHSNMRGELNNDRWQYELTRRNNNGFSDPNITRPPGTENNQFDEIFNNPR